jgi:hypothetical protein
MAPLIAKLIASGLSILAPAVIAKGKEFVQDKIGIDLEDALGSEAGRYKLKQLELTHEQFLIEAALAEKNIDFNFAKLDVENTNNARDMNKAIQTSAEASYISKVLPYWLDAIIVGGTLLFGYLLFFVKLPVENREIALTLFGVLAGMCGTVLNFHRGTNRQSQLKDATISKLAGEA